MAGGGNSPLFQPKSNISKVNKYEIKLALNCIVLREQINYGSSHETGDSREDQQYFYTDNCTTWMAMEVKKKTAKFP